MPDDGAYLLRYSACDEASRRYSRMHLAPVSEIMHSNILQKSDSALLTQASQMTQAVLDLLK